MAGETALASMTHIMGVFAIVASAGCDAGVTPLGKDQTHPDPTAHENVLRGQVELDVTAMIEGMMLAHGLRLGSVQSQP